MSHEWILFFEYLSNKLTSGHFDICPHVNLNFPGAKIWFLSSNANVCVPTCRDYELSFWNQSWNLSPVSLQLSALEQLNLTFHSFSFFN